MPRRASIKPVQASWAGKRQWKVELPASIASNGRRKRQFFAKNFGTAGISSLSVFQLSQAAEAFSILAKHRVTLPEVVSDWVARRTASEASVPFESAMDGFLEWGRRSPSYGRSIRQTRNRLIQLHGKLLNTITPADIALATSQMRDSVRNFTVRILGGVFNWGIKRDYCSHNPTKKLDLAKREAVEIEIYSPAEVSAILKVAQANDPELLPFLAISFFCGIRRSETLRLDWSSIELSEKFIRLPAAITKTRQSRHIQISPNCQAFLEPFAKANGPLTPVTSEALRKRLAALAAVHGIGTIKHGARHCFASYWLAKNGDINQLCRFLGHDDPATTFKHYAKAATKRDAQKFFAIVPSERLIGRSLAER